MSLLSLLPVGARMAPAVSTYTPRDPSGTVLYHVIAEHLETFLASCHDDPEATGLPDYVQREFYDYLRCGILAYGFLPLRYWMASSQDLTAKVHTIIRTTVGQYYVNQAVTQGHKRANIHPGSVTFIQRFGSALNLNLHFHCVFMEGVYLDRTDAGRKP